MSVQETKEAFVGVLLLGALVAGKFKDGVQVADFSAILRKLSEDVEFKAKIDAATKDADKISAELAALDLKGGLELVQSLISALPEVQALLKPAV